MKLEYHILLRSTVTPVTSYVVKLSVCSNILFGLAKFRWNSVGPWPTLLYTWRSASTAVNKQYTASCFKCVLFQLLLQNMFLYNPHFPVIKHVQFIGLNMLKTICSLFTILYCGSKNHIHHNSPVHPRPNYNSFIGSTSVINKCGQKADEAMFVEAESQGVCCAVVWGKCSGVACLE